MKTQAAVSVINLMGVRLRLVCKCGATLVVLPAALKPTVFQCANCLESWPRSEHPPFGHLRQFIEAVQRFQIETARRADDPESRNYSVHFEIDVETR